MVGPRIAIIGKVYRFDARAARDAWVDDDSSDVNLRREALSSDEARREMAHRVVGATSLMPMDELWDAYNLEVSF